MHAVTRVVRRSRPRSSRRDERESGLRAILNFGHTFAPRDRDGGRLRRLAARRGGRLRHGDGGRPVGAPRPDRAVARAAPRRLDRRRRPAGARARARRGTLSRTDAARQEGRRPAALRFIVSRAPGRAALRYRAAPRPPPPPIRAFVGRVARPLREIVRRPAPFALRSLPFVGCGRLALAAAFLHFDACQRTAMTPLHVDSR